MNERLTQKWCLVAMLEDVAEGHEFTKGNWPLHITLVGVHALGWQNMELRHDFEDLAKDIKSIKIRARKRGELGPVSKPTQVVFFEKSNELSLLHTRLVRFLRNNGAVFNNPEWNLSGYIPHSTVQKHTSVQPNTEVVIDNITLIDMFPHADRAIRKVTRSLKLY